MTMVGRITVLLVVGLVISAGPAGQTIAEAKDRLESGQIQLDLPVDCEMGKVCVVQHYVDMSPGPAAQDHTCGSLTYDGHDGIDIRTLRYAQMYGGVDVLAAAAGVVRRTRDGMSDMTVRDEATITALGKRKAGNAVVIDHGEGWETQYSHLKRNSILVRPGDRVEAGQRLGQIGLSGKTQFPHVEFSLRRNGKWIDPFTGRTPGSGCGEPATSLWSDAARTALAYRPGGLLASGISGEVLEYPAFLELTSVPAPSSASPVLIAWVVAWGVRKGDLWTLRLTDPAGTVLAERTDALAKHRHRWYRYLGKKRPPGGWPSGTYQTSIEIVRPEGPHAGVLVSRRHSITLP